MEKIFFEKGKLGRIIGRNGETKISVEKELKVKLRIKQAPGGGEISIVADPHKTYVVMQILQAIAVGFPAEDAFQINNDYILEFIELRRYAKTKTRKTEIKSRVIGKKGKVMKNIRNLTGVLVSVQNDEIALLGRTEDVYHVKAAVENLVRGTPHAKIFKILEKKEGRFSE